ncbi:MAG TPA: hypothetical protein PKA37_04455 [Planctomycetota bacterium]|jgi:hypothetical protein|nr:hypothetical protein [Planctomycetota bacterium]
MTSSPKIEFVLIIKPDAGVGASDDSLALIPQAVVSRLFNDALIAQILDGDVLTTEAEAQNLLQTLLTQTEDGILWSVVPLDSEPHYLDQGIWRSPDGFGAQFRLLRGDLSYPTPDDGNAYGEKIVGTISVYYPTP